MPQEETIQVFVHATELYFLGDLKAAQEELNKAEQLARESQNKGLLGSILVQSASWLRESGQGNERRRVLAEISELIPFLKTNEYDVVFTGLRLEQAVEAMHAADFTSAEKLLREAETKARGTGWGITLLSDILANLGSTYLSMGRLEDAQTRLQEAIKIDHDTGDKRKLANDLNILALTYDVTGDHETALSYFNQAIETALEGNFIKEATDSLANSSIYLEEAGRLEEAQSGYEAALHIYELAGYQVEAVNMKSNLAIIVSKRGDYLAAREMLTQTVDDHEKMGDQIHAIHDLVNLAQMEIHLGEGDSAYTHASSACEQAKSSGMLSVLWAAHWLMAKALGARLKSLSDPDEKAKGLEGILENYEKAAEALELLRAEIGRSEEREQFLLNKEELYEEATVLAGILHKGRQAFAFSERARARAFLDIMGAQRIQQKSAESPLLLHRELLTQQILSLRGNGNSSKELYEELRMVRAQIIAEEPAAAAVTEATLPSYEDIAKVIPEDTALVEFFIGPKQNLTIFVLRSGNRLAMTVTDLGSWDLPAKIEQFRAELKYEVEGVPTGQELFWILFGEVWKVIDPVKRLLIVPHRELHLIPFSALWYKSAGESPKQVFLCERFSHTILPSASFLPQCLNLSRPLFQKGNARVISNPSGDLAYAEEEGLIVAVQLGVTQLTGGEATRQALLKEEPGLGVVHVASHGVFDEFDPLLSGVVMADGQVTAEDIMNSKLNAGLLTLSGCVTGLARRKPGDELIGLSRAAASAGIPSVVTSLWEVYDESSSEFFAYFYYALANGASKDWALLTAQQSLMKQKQFEHPVHWAPFVLFGDWR